MTRFCIPILEGDTAYMLNKQMWWLGQFFWAVSQISVCQKVPAAYYNIEMPVFIQVSLLTAALLR